MPAHPRAIRGESQNPVDDWDGTWDTPVVYRTVDGTVAYAYRDGTGKAWWEYYYPDGSVQFWTTYSMDAHDEDEWHKAEDWEEPVGVVESHVEKSPPLEESTPLFGPQEEPVLEPEHGPWDQPRGGHWDPAALRWVPDDPTIKFPGILDDGHTGSRGESRPAADQESSDDGHTDTRGGRWPAAGEESSDGGRMGSRGESRPAADQESSAADHNKADLDDVAGPLRSGHWDPAALRWVYDDPTMKSAGILGDENAEDTQIPGGGGGAGSAQGEGGLEQDPILEQGEDAADTLIDEPTTRRSAGILGDDENAEDTQVPVEGGAAGGVDPSVPFVPDTTPTSVEGTAAAPFNVDSTSFEGSTARGFDPSVPLDRADPNLQSLDRSLFDLNAPGPTLDPALFDEAEPGPTLDPKLFDSNAPGPTLDPALFDLTSPGPTVDPALFDERAPGPTLDPALLDHDAPGPNLDPNRLDPSAPGDTLDEAQLERASERPNSVEEPSDVKGRGDTDPRAMEEPAHPEPRHGDHDDHDEPLDVG